MKSETPKIIATIILYLFGIAILIGIGYVCWFREDLLNDPMFWENLGYFSVFFVWLALNIFCIVKAFKLKKKVWAIALILNVVVIGWFLPTSIGLILPIIYLIINRKNKK